MPDLESFVRELQTRLDGAVNVYYDAVEAAGTAQGLFQPLMGRIAVGRALSTLRTDLRATLTLGYQVAGAMGNGERALDEMQNRQVLAKLGEALNYLDGFIADVKQMSRAQALARIAKYLPPVVQTFSQMATSDLPELPIMPGDPRLECVRHAKGIRVCRCYLKVERVGPNDWDVYWVQTAAESCTDCEALGKAWNPLKIRKGRIVAPERRAA